MTEEEQWRLDMTFFCMGFLLGSLAETRIREEMIASIRRPEGFHRGYLKMLHQEMGKVLDRTE